MLNLTPSDAADRLEMIAKGGIPQSAIPTAPEGMLVGLKPFRLPLGPSQWPNRTLKINEGDMFSLDGDEPGGIKPWVDEGYCEWVRLTDN